MSTAVSEHVFPAAYTHDENRQRFVTLLFGTCERCGGPR